MLAPAVHWLSRLTLNLRSPPSPLHLERLDLECLRGEPAPRLSHYARMDPDSSHLSPSRKHNTGQISRHYLDTLAPPIWSYMTISHVCLAGPRRTFIWSLLFFNSAHRLLITTGAFHMRTWLSPTGGKLFQSPAALCWLYKVWHW